MTHLTLVAVHTDATAGQGPWESPAAPTCTGTLAVLGLHADSAFVMTHAD